MGRTLGEPLDSPGMTESVADLDALSTEELRHRAFAKARRNGDVRFFWSVVRHLPHADDAESLDGSLWPLDNLAVRP